MRFILPLLLLFSISAVGQVNMDSLWGVWNDESQPDTSRLKAMNRIAWDGYLFSQPDSAFYFAELEKKLAVKKNLSKWVGDALNTQGVSLWIRGEYDEAMKLYHQSSQ